MKAIAQKSLKTQIALVAGTLVVAVSAALSYALGEMLTQRIRSDAGAALQVVSSHGARLLASGIEQRSVQVEVLARSASLWRNGVDSPEVLQMLERAQAINSFSRWMGVATPDGTVRASAANLLLGQNVGERPWFTGAKDGLYVGDVHPAKLLAALLPAPANHEPLRFVDFSAPIRVDGRLLGILGLHISWDWAQETLEQALPDPAARQGVELFIFDRKGELILAPADKTQPLRTAGQRLPGLAAAEETASSGAPRNSGVLAWKDGVDYLTSVTRLPARNAATDIGWYVVAREPAALAFADVRSATRNALLLGALAAVLASLVGWLGARKLSADINELVRAVRRLGSEGRKVDIPVLDSNREVQALSEALRGTTGQLLDMQDHMEALVRERTRELEVANRTLDNLAHSDPLTGLLNRRGFDTQMERAMATARRTGRPLAVMMVDADHFKRVNDNFGHNVGDEVLRMLGRELRVRLRESDVAARYGGEEFVALLPETDLEGAYQLARQITTTIAARNDPVYGRITVSAGVAVMVSPDVGAHDLLQRADAALYSAKESGRNRVCRYPYDLVAQAAQPAAD